MDYLISSKAKKRVTRQFNVTKPAWCKYKPITLRLKLKIKKKSINLWFLINKWNTESWIRFRKNSLDYKVALENIYQTSWKKLAYLKISFIWLSVLEFMAAHDFENQNIDLKSKESIDLQNKWLLRKGCNLHTKQFTLMEGSSNERVQRYIKLTRALMENVVHW
jgi:hypothetical protein